MPSKSKAQHNLMMAVAHSPAFAKKVGIPTSVGKEFAKADEGKKFRSGGVSARQGVNQPKTHHGEKALFKQGGQIMATKKMSSGGDTTMSNPSREKKGLTMEKMGKVTAGGKRAHGEHTVQQKGHTKGKQVAMKASKPLGMKKGGKC